MLKALWAHASAAERPRLFAAVRAQMGALPLYGANSRELMQLVGSMMSSHVSSGDAGGEGEGASGMTTQMLVSRMILLKEQASLLATHPNAYVYNALGGMLEVDGHFLESEPLHASNQPELPSQQVRHLPRPPMISHDLP